MVRIRFTELNILVLHATWSLVWLELGTSVYVLQIIVFFKSDEIYGEVDEMISV